MGRIERESPDKTGNEIYPPPLNYKWLKIEDVAEADQKIINKKIGESSPYYKPREIIVPFGRKEEQKIINLAFVGAMSNLSTTRKDFPLIETLERTEFGFKSTILTAIGCVSFPITIDGKEHTSTLFIQHNKAEEPQYTKARTMCLDSTNTILKDLKRNTIPPPSFKEYSTALKALPVPLN